MKSVKRWRYYCDFCKKAGQSGFHMKNHEASCTLNPARVCKMCAKLEEGPQADMAAMLALLPDPAGYMVEVPADEWTAASVVMDDKSMRARVVPALAALRELVNGCPVCIMAAFRQKKIPLPLVEDFNFTKEMQSLWSDINSEQDEREYY